MQAATLATHITSLYMRVNVCPPALERFNTELRLELVVGGHEL